MQWGRRAGNELVVEPRFSRHRRRVGVWATLAAGFVAALGMSPARAALTPNLGTDGMTVGGVTPGGSMLAMGVSHTPEAGGMVLARQDWVVADQDADGSVALQLGKVPELSVWAFVDLGAGAQALQAAAAFEAPLEEPWPGGSPVAYLAGGAPVVRVDGAIAELLWVRPGVGAWKARAGDGADADADGVVDGTILVSLSDFSAVGAAAVELPSSLASGDLLIRVELETLKISRFIVPGEAP